MPVSSQAIMRTVPDTGMVDFIIVAAIWRAQNIVQEFERLPKWGEISAVPPIEIQGGGITKEGRFCGKRGGLESFRDQG